MASDPPPSAPPARAARPRYLVVALVTALIFGAGCWTSGCAQLQVYRGLEKAGPNASAHALIRDDQERAHVEALYKRYLDASDDARSKGIPLAAATFVLGAALLALASRALAGKTNARMALMQVVAVQAIVGTTHFYAMRDATNAELDWWLAGNLAYKRQTARPEEYAKWAPIYHARRRYEEPTVLVLRVVASVLVLFALTQRRSREFFEAAADTAPDS
jgi:hypothetical protein